MQLTRVLFGALIAVGYFPSLSLAQIKIGVAEALTGNAAQYGVPIRKGFELAVSEINGSGGINGQKIELVIEDEQGKKEEAINVFKKLIFQDKVLMLFGPTLSNSAQASDPVAQGAKVVVFGTSNTADGITSIGNLCLSQFGHRGRYLAGDSEGCGAENRSEKSRGALRQRRYFYQERLRQFQESAASAKNPGDHHRDFRQGRRRFQTAADQDQGEQCRRCGAVGIGRRGCADRWCKRAN